MRELKESNYAMKVKNEENLNSRQELKQLNDEERKFALEESKLFV